MKEKRYHIIAPDIVNSRAAAWLKELQSLSDQQMREGLVVIGSDDAEVLAIILAGSQLEMTVHHLDHRYPTQQLADFIGKIASSNVFVGAGLYDQLSEDLALPQGTVRKLMQSATATTAPSPDFTEAWQHLDLYIHELDLSGNDETRHYQFSNLIHSWSYHELAGEEMKKGRGFLVSASLPFSHKLQTYYQSYEVGTTAYQYLGAPHELTEAINQMTHEMGFGIFFFGSYVPDGSNPYQSILDLVSHADRQGFGAVWTPERHFNEFGGLFPDPAVLSAALAMNTESINIRSGSLVSPLHDSLRIAENWSVVDNLSKGRVSVSFAAGWQCDDFIFYPDRYAERDQVMFDQVNKVRELWKGHETEVRNGNDKNIKVRIYPEPIQDTLPVWVTVSGKTETFIQAGKCGANILTHLLWQDKSELIDKIAAYRKSLADNGHDPKKHTVTVMVHTYMAETVEEAHELVRKPLKEYIRSSVFLIEKMVSSTKSSNDKFRDAVGRYGNVVDNIPPALLDELLEIAVNRFLTEAGLFGNVDNTLSLIQTLKSFDVDEVACLIDFGPSHEEILRGLDQLNKLRKYCDPSANPAGISYLQLSREDYEAVKAQLDDSRERDKRILGGLVCGQDETDLLAVDTTGFTGVYLNANAQLETVTKESEKEFLAMKDMMSGEIVKEF